MDMSDTHEVISAFLDDEPFDASQLAEMASQAKHHAKNVQGYSVHVIDSLVVQEPEGVWLTGQR